MPLVEAACRDIGFMYVSGHGIPGALIEETRRSVSHYFAQTAEVKLADQITRDNYRGFIPQGFFSPGSGDSTADNYEGYKLHNEIGAEDPICGDCDLYGPNKWPESTPGLRDVLLEYWAECDRVTAVLLGALSKSLEIPTDDFLQLFDKSLTNMTLLHYPPQAVNSNQFGIHPHKDTDALTIVAADPVGGLKVRRRDDSGWIDADPPGDALVVNIGDLLEIWSGGHFVSTPHKVENISRKRRISFPYFSVPRYDVVVSPLRESEAGFQRDPVHVGDVSREVWRSNWPDAQGDGRFDIGTLAN